MHDGLAAQQQPRHNQFEPHRIDAPVYIRHVNEVYDGKTLMRLLLQKIVRRFQGKTEVIAPIVSYNGLTVFDRPDLEGGGLTYGADYARLFVELGIGACQRMFEFCAGPGYIGFFLFSLGYCRELVLADINPAAGAAARRTVEFNGLSDRVMVFQSDGLAGIPVTEKWDVAVGNPPHFLTADERVALRAADADWAIHAAFYGSIGKFMNDGGRVILVENGEGSSVADFEPMIVAAGGQLEGVVPARNALGNANGSYFVISRW
jgi:hypothetical protein